MGDSSLLILILLFFSPFFSLSFIFYYGTTFHPSRYFFILPCPTFTFPPLRHFLYYSSSFSSFLSLHILLHLLLFLVLSLLHLLPLLLISSLLLHLLLILIVISCITFHPPRHFSPYTYSSIYFLSSFCPYSIYFSSSSFRPYSFIYSSYSSFLSLLLILLVVSLPTHTPSFTSPLPRFVPTPPLTFHSPCHSFVYHVLLFTSHPHQHFPPVRYSSIFCSFHLYSFLSSSYF